MRQRIVIHNRFSKLFLACIFAVNILSLSCEKDDKYDYHVINPDDQGPQADIMLVSGNNQTGVVGSPLPDSLIVYVSLEYVPKPSWTVNFEIIQGEGTLSMAANVTDTRGYTWTMLTPTGLPGEVKVKASPFLSDSSVVFTATAVSP